MSRPDNWKDQVYRICLHCKYHVDDCPGKAFSRYICDRTGKPINVYDAGCCYWADIKKYRAKLREHRNTI